MASFPLMSRHGYTGHNLLNDAELAVWGFAFHFSNQEQTVTLL